MTDAGRVPREIPDLVDSLRRHVKLLREFSVRAFQGGDSDYLGEVAAKLRLLVHEKGHNKPLLLALMDEFEMDIPITLGGPPIKLSPGQPSPGDQVSVRQYLNLTAYGVRVPSRGFVEITKKDLIAIWAQQHGAAHEDWDLQEEFAIVRNSGLFIGGLPALAAELRVTTETVLHVADKFLAALTPGLIALKSAERALERDPNSIPTRHSRGAALGQLGRYEEALAEFQKVTEAEPMNAKVQNNMGLALQHLRRFPEAIQAYQHAIEIDEKYADAHYNLACVYSLQGEFEKCLEELECVKRIDEFAGETNPASDSDLSNIRTDPHYGPRFLALVRKTGEST